MKLGIHQLRILVVLGSPTMHLIVLDRIAKTLLGRGLLRHSKTGGYVITAPGLRALAEAMDAGRVDEVMELMKHEADARRRSAA